MKSKLSKVILGAVFFSLVACNKNSEDKKGAVPASPERVYATTFNGQTQVQDQNNYCDISVVSGAQKSLICYSAQVNLQPCAGSAVQFTDATMCPVINQTLQSPYGQQCGQRAMISLYQQRCSNINNGLPNQINNPGYPLPAQPITQIGTQPLDPNFKTIQCDFEALRHVQGRWINRDYNTGRLTTSIIIDSRLRQEIDLRSKFLVFDIGSFGVTKMIYTPAGLKGSADKMTVLNKGLNETMTTSQSGFAGEEVRLEAQNDEGSMRLVVSCKGQSQFKKNLATKTYTKLSCKGTSSLGSRTEKIDLMLPYDISLTQNEITLAENLVMKVSGDTSGQDNARISFTTTKVNEDLTVQSSAYLKTNTQLKINDGYSEVDVSCTPL